MSERCDKHGWMNARYECPKCYAERIEPARPSEAKPREWTLECCPNCGAPKKFDFGGCEQFVCQTAECPAYKEKQFSASFRKFIEHAAYQALAQENAELRRELKEAKNYDLTTAVLAKDIETIDKLTRELAEEKKRAHEIAHEQVLAARKGRDEARAECERLRAAARNPTAYPTAMDYAESLERENATIREALERIAALDACSQCLSFGYPASAHEIAREALSEKT